MKKPGRPKNPRLRALENKLEAMTQQLEDMQHSQADALDEDSLNCIGMGCIKRNGRYILIVIKYDPATKMAKVVEERDVGDANHRATFELQKFLTYNFLFEEITDAEPK